MPAATDQATQVLEGRDGVTAVEGVGEVPRGHAARLAEERQQFVLTDAGAFAVRGGEELEQGGEASDVLAEVGPECVRGRPVKVDGRRLKLAREPGLTSL